VHLEHRGRLVAVGRAVQQDVEAAETLHRGGHGAPAARPVGDVEMHRERLAAAGLDLGGGRLRARLLDVGARDFGAGRREGERGRAPDPIRGPDHDGDLFLEREPRIDHHVLHAVPSTPAERQMNTAVYEMAPDIPERLRARGDEILGHGVTNSDEQRHLGEDQERALIESVTATIARHEGAPPAGWMSPWLSNSAVTMDLLQEAGY